jgi:hypothetical protein
MGIKYRIVVGIYVCCSTGSMDDVIVSMAAAWITYGSKNPVGSI